MKYVQTQQIRLNNKQTFYNISGCNVDCKTLKSRVGMSSAINTRRKIK
jgi:hypothetical protein